MLMLCVFKLSKHRVNLAKNKFQLSGCCSKQQPFFWQHTGSLQMLYIAKKNLTFDDKFTFAICC
jgi:hypothetical protein